MLEIVVVLTVTLWYPSLNPVVGRFGTKYELNSGKGPVTFHFEFVVEHHNVLMWCSSFGKVPQHHIIEFRQGYNNITL